MKKILCILLGLSISSLVTAKTVTNIVKLTGQLGEISESGDSFSIKTTKGDLWLYEPLLDEKSTTILLKAQKLKSCVKITQKDYLNTKIVKVDCPTKLQPIKQPH